MKYLSKANVNMEFLLFSLRHWKWILNKQNSSLKYWIQLEDDVFARKLWLSKTFNSV